MEIIFEKVSLIINKGTPLEKTILNNVSFSLKENKIITFVGASNSGKTAIAELIDALISPTKGIIKLGEFYNDGKIIKNVNNLRKKIGYIYNNPYDMFFNKTVEDEIAFGAYNFNYKKNILKERVLDSLKLVGLSEEYLDKNPLDLNLGDAKRVALACTLIYNPEVIILDEIEIGLNYKDKKNILRIIKTLKEKYNKTIILLTKNTDFIYGNVDKVFVMNKTKLIESGEEELLRNKKLLESSGLTVPKIVEVITKIREKNIDMEDYTDIKDLIKGVFRNVF